jgi:histidyl-tRNA synthetase
MKSVIQSVKGTREFYPREMYLRHWIYSLVESVSKSFGYDEYDGPFLERIDLYAAKSGEELVKEQAFVFADRGGDLVTLRPELTPSLARMIVKRQNELVFPLRWWSFGPFWRYEKPQKGRTREFFQWNIDMIGVDSAEADAELVAICATVIKKAGLGSDQVKIMLNHRKLMEKKLNELGIPLSNLKQVFSLIDRSDKLPNDEWDRQAGEIGLDSSTVSQLKGILGNQELWQESEELTLIFGYLEAYGVKEYVSYDPRIIRGLDYYTGVVFEAWDVGGDGRAILGGGHYDNLVGDVGGSPLPGVGFAMGDVMFGLILGKYGCIPETLKISNSVLVTCFAPDQFSDSIRIATALRENGLTAIVYPESAKLQKQFKFADRIGARFVIVIGPDEIREGKVTVKDMKNSGQQTIPASDLSAIIIAMLAIP